MSSLFTRIAARGLQVPAVDRRIAAHAERPVSPTQNQGPAAQSVDTSDAVAAPVQVPSDVQSGTQEGDGSQGVTDGNV